MKRTALALLASVVAASALLTSSAAASGPAPPGKEIVEVQCEGLPPLLVSVTRNEHGQGAGQIVGEKGHGILVSDSFSVFDVTTGQPVFSDTQLKGGGHAHRNQSAVGCSSEPQEVEAALFFGEEELPPGVGPTNTLRLENAFQVIVKK